LLKETLTNTKEKVKLEENFLQHLLSIDLGGGVVEESKRKIDPRVQPMVLTPQKFRRDQILRDDLYDPNLSVVEYWTEDWYVVLA
jgi:hypothetical protein